MKTAYLVMQDRNHNKFYNMVQDKNDDTVFNVEYGAIGKTSLHYSYNMLEWRRVYKQKMKKGYIDISTNGMTVNSVVKTQHNDLGIITRVVSYSNNMPVYVEIMREKRPDIVEPTSNLVPGYLNPTNLIHKGLYPKLVGMIIVNNA